MEFQIYKKKFGALVALFLTFFKSKDLELTTRKIY